MRSLINPTSIQNNGPALDGELCAMDDVGRTDFSLPCSGLRNGGCLTYCAFDLLELDGLDLRRRSLAVRKIAFG